MIKSILQIILVVSFVACSSIDNSKEVLVLQSKAIKADRSHSSADSALYYIDRAIYLSPNDFSSYMIKAEVLTSRGQCQKALDMIETMPMNVRESVGGLQTIGIVYEQMGRYSEAKTLYQKALRDYSEPEYSSMHDIHLIASYWFLLTAGGDKKGALESVERIRHGSLSEREVMYLEEYKHIIDTYQGGGMLELKKKEKTCPNNS